MRRPSRNRHEVGTRGTRRLFRSAGREVSDVRAKKPGFLAEARKPSILTGPVHPFGSLAALSVPLGRLRAHGFASPPHDGFAIIEDQSVPNCAHSDRTLDKEISESK